MIVLRKAADMPSGERIATIADPEGNPIELANHKQDPDARRQRRRSRGADPGGAPASAPILSCGRGPASGVQGLARQRR